MLGSHLPWGDPRRGWDFVSTGHGDVPWEDSFRALDAIGYAGPDLDRVGGRRHGPPARRRRGGRLHPLAALEAPDASFDAAFSNQGTDDSGADA